MNKLINNEKHQNTLNDEFEKYLYSSSKEVWRKKLPLFNITTSERVNYEPRISIIIANYNNEKYLDRMFQSLINQTLGLDNMQIMFIDDKSTDNSLDIASQYAKKYDGFEIYSLKENTGGAYGPRNVGILNARGEYIVFLDSDDWYDLNALKYMIQLLDTSEDNMAFTGMVQSVNGILSLKSKPYFFEGDKFNRHIETLSSEFYGWLGPQSIVIRRSLIIKYDLHFIHQRVADDVMFFFQAMYLSQTITQGSKLTTYLNRDQDNNSLSKGVDKDFMISWLRMLGYINKNYPENLAKEKFLSRRLEWLVYDFCLRRDIGYPFGLARLQDFKKNIVKYLGKLTFNPSIYFRTDARKVAWKYMVEEDFIGLVRFNNWHSISHIVNKKLGVFHREGDIYFFPKLNKSFPSIKINMRAIAKECSEKYIYIDVFTKETVNYFELRNKEKPFERKKLYYEKLSKHRYRVEIPEDFDNEIWNLLIISNIWHEHGIENLKKIEKINKKRF